MNIKEFVADTVRRALGGFHEAHPPGKVLVAEYNVTTAQELLAHLGKASFAPIVVKRGTDYYTAVLSAPRNEESAVVRVIGSSGGDYFLFTYTVTGSSWASSSYGLQKKLVSGTDIKTINGQSLLGSGDISSYVAPADTGWKVVEPTVDTQIRYRRIGDVVWLRGRIHVTGTTVDEPIRIEDAVQAGFVPDSSFAGSIILFSDVYEGYVTINLTSGSIIIYCTNNDSNERYLVFNACYPVSHLSNEEIAALAT